MPGDEECRALRVLTPRHRVDAEEYIDRPETPVDDIRDTLRDQALVNRRLGGTHATLAHALPLLRASTSDPVRILDAACGGADLSRRIIDEARKLARPVEVTAMDLNEKAIECARQAAVGYPEITFVHGDALRPPFDSGEFDVVILATFLHHLSPSDAVAALQAAKRLSRGAVVAADLVRSPLACLGIHIFARLARFNPISTHDGAVSVCRAYTPRELAGLARQARLEPSRIYRHRFYRMTLVYEHAREGLPGDE